MKLQRTSAGSYRLPGTPYAIIRTEWEGPAGGKRYVWEIARDMPGMGLCIDETAPGETLREAKQSLAERLRRNPQPKEEN